MVDNEGPQIQFDAIFLFVVIILPCFFWLFIIKLINRKIQPSKIFLATGANAISLVVGSAIFLQGDFYELYGKNGNCMYRYITN